MTIPVTGYYPPRADTGGWMLNNSPFHPMTDPTPKPYADLSPAAQAALDAALRPRTTRQSVAAALRAVADQSYPVVPVKWPPDDKDRVFRGVIRADILAIAYELDPQP